MPKVVALAFSVLLAPVSLAAQDTAALSEEVRKYVAVSEPIVALRNVRVLDGTGVPARDRQTVLIRDGRIEAVGRAGQVRIPKEARILDLGGHTVIPGLVGLHNHLFYMAAGGRQARLSRSGPRLYLASGVTTIRTTGSVSPYADISTKAAVDRGEAPGPRIHITAPYVTGGDSPGAMAAVSTPEEARRFVAYWASEGATWIKAYTDIRRSELRAAIEEAHARGLKVTGHLCSVTFREAVDLGIDNLEHGFMTNTDFDPEKTPDTCPANTMIRVGSVSAEGDEARRTIEKMLEHGVPMTSTLAVFEPFIPGRPTKDPRTLDAMAPEVREAYLAARTRIDTATNYPFTEEMLKNHMEFERAFVEAGGLLASGVDPTGIGGALPGYGDQRNYEMLVEAGLTPEQVVQVVSANGAKILGVYDRLGSVEAGKIADLVVLKGDLRSDPSVIRNVILVFKDGVGYDSAKLIESVKGRVGID